MDPTQVTLSHRRVMNFMFKNSFYISASAGRAYLYVVDNFLQGRFCIGL